MLLVPEKHSSAMISVRNITQELNIFKIGKHLIHSTKIQSYYQQKYIVYIYIETITTI